MSFGQCSLSDGERGALDLLIRMTDRLSPGRGIAQQGKADVGRFIGLGHGPPCCGGPRLRFKCSGGPPLHVPVHLPAHAGRRNAARVPRGACEGEGRFLGDTGRRRLGKDRYLKGIERWGEIGGLLVGAVARVGSGCMVTLATMISLIRCQESFSEPARFRN